MQDLYVVERKKPLQRRDDTPAEVHFFNRMWCNIRYYCHACFSPVDVVFFEFSDESEECFDDCVAVDVDGNGLSG